MVAGLLIGFAVGLLVGPILRSWLAWREFVDAGREARLADDVLRHMSDFAARGEGEEDPAIRSSR